MILIKKFNEINSRNEFFEFLKVKKETMNYILYVKKTECSYNTFKIKKKNGGFREINAPDDELKVIQKKFALSLWLYQKEIWNEKGIKPNISHAFEENKSIRSNARIHKKKKIVLNLDLENFFKCFHFGRVKGFFEKDRDFKVPPEVAVVIAQLTCYNGSLPQGAPSSPIITNLISRILDFRILKLAKKFKLDYTRYADDLTFSTNRKSFLDDYKDFLDELSKEILRAGFKINMSKTRMQYSDSKQLVTGLVVNEKVNIDSTYYRKTRAIAHNLYKGEDIEINGEKATINNLEGRFAFINQLDRYNNKINAVGKKKFSDRNGRERQYKKFLFYKYFFANNKPLIVTEGKTDIKYIKSALKKLYKDYPNLITKKSDGTFEYKVSFLKKTKRLSYFLEIPLDGASAFLKIYNFYTPHVGLKDPYINYSEEFKRISGSQAKQPVFLLFDNEMDSKSKTRPLKEFVEKAKIKEDEISKLKDNLTLQVVDNLYILTIPLVANKKECEIEDLFDKKVLEKMMEGKTFQRNEKIFNKEKHYGKEFFSNHIVKNYESVDFSKFKKILDNIDSISQGFKPL